MAPRFLGRATAEYLKAQIDAGNPQRAKRALQELCKLYRTGHRLLPQMVFAFETAVVGCLYTMRDQAKVRRWSLNALARFEHEAQSIEAVRHVLLTYPHEPQTVAAGVAAVYKLSARPAEILRRTTFDPQMVTLAALQHAPAAKLDLSGLPIDVDGAAPDLLRLALLLVGLDRAPPHMLNPRHSNEAMVRVLGGHDDNMVVQYSVWAVTENADLGIRNLGVSLKDIETQPA